MVAGRPRRVCLRAEVCAGEREVVANTHEISPDGVVVEAEPFAAIGECVNVMLSLPRHVEPLAFHGTVVDLRGTGAPGDPFVMSIRFDGGTQEAIDALADLFQRLDESPGAARDAASAYRILIVDDNELMRDLLGYGVRKFFRRQGALVAVDYACDGLEAWHLLEATMNDPAGGGYDLAVVDRYLPVLDGARLVERMRLKPELAPVLVVGVSGGGHDARDSMLAAGADLFLHKPIVLRDVFSTLESLTRKDAYDHGRSQAGVNRR